MYLRNVICVALCVASSLAASATPSDQKINVLVQKINAFQFSSDDYSRNATQLKQLYGEIGDSRSFLWNTATDEKGDALMHRAVMARDLLAIKLLSSWKADVNVHNVQNGSTPLHYAVYNRYSSSVDTLLELGASPDVTNNEGLLPGERMPLRDEEIQLRLVQARHKTLEYIRTQIPTLQQICIHTLTLHKIDMTSMPVDRQYDATTQQLLNTKLHTHLFDAAVDHADINLLLSRGADPNCNQYNSDSIKSDMPLLRAVRQFLNDPASRERSWANIDALLKYGAHPDAHNVRGHDPAKSALECCAHLGLEYLASGGDLEQYQTLLAKLRVKEGDVLQEPIGRGMKSFAELLCCCITSSRHSNKSPHHPAFQAAWKDIFGMSWPW